MGRENNGKYWYIIPDCRFIKKSANWKYVRRKMKCSISSLVSRMLNLDRIVFYKFIYFIVNNYYYIVNCWYINRVTIYKAKYLGIVTLKVLPLRFFRYKLERKSIKFAIPKMKLNKIRVSLCKFYNKMFRRLRENVRF